MAESAERPAFEETPRPAEHVLRGADARAPATVVDVQDDPEKTLEYPVTKLESPPSEALDRDDTDAHRLLVAEEIADDVDEVAAAPEEIPDDVDEVAAAPTEEGPDGDTTSTESAPAAVPAATAISASESEAPATAPATTVEPTTEPAASSAVPQERMAREAAPALPAASIPPGNGHANGSHMTRRQTTQLGQLLLDAGLLSEEQLEAALLRQRETGERIDTLLVSEGYLDEAHLLSTLAQLYGVPAVDLDSLALDPGLTKLVPHEMARRNLVVPLALHDDSVDVAMVDPTDFVVMAHLRFATGVRPNVFITTVAAALRALDRMYEDHAEAEHDEEPPVDRREAIKQMILDRDALLLSADDPRKLYGLGISIEAFVDEILRKADGGR